MPAARERLLVLLGQMLAPLIQLAFADPQVSRNLAHWFPARLDEPHRFQFELPCVVFCSFAILHSFGRVYSTFPPSTKSGQAQFSAKCKLGHTEVVINTVPLPGSLADEAFFQRCERIQERTRMQYDKLRMEVEEEITTRQETLVRLEPAPKSRTTKDDDN